MTKVLDKIVEKFGSQQQLARSIGCTQSTVAQWKRRGGLVPARKQVEILNAAKRMGIDLQPSDFFEEAA